MSSWTFRKRMLDAAKAEKKGNSESRKILMHPSVSEELFQILARIGRATNLRPVTVLIQYLKNHEKELEVIALATEKAAPAERLRQPLAKSERKAPKMKDLKEFAAAKKKEMKK